MPFATLPVVIATVTGSAIDAIGALTRSVRDSAADSLFVVLVNRLGMKSSM